MNAVSVPWVCRRCQHMMLVDVGDAPVCEKCKYDTTREDEYDHYHIDGVMAQRTWRTLWRRKLLTIFWCFKTSLPEEVVEHVDNQIAKHPKASLVAYRMNADEPPWVYSQNGPKATAKLVVEITDEWN
jgi:hypothetical protein